MSSEETEEYFINVDGKIIPHGSLIPKLGNSKKGSEISLSCLLPITSSGIEILTSSFSLLGIGDLIHDIWIDQYWINFAVRHIIPAVGGGCVYAILNTLFKYSFQYQQEKSKNPELRFFDFLLANLSDAKFYLLAFCVVSSSAFTVLTSTAELAKTLHFHELSKDSLSIGLGLMVYITGNFGLELPWEKIFVELAAVLTGFTAGRYLCDHNIMNKWAPVVLSSGAAVAANIITKTISYSCSFWSSRRNEIIEVFDARKAINIQQDFSGGSKSKYN